MQDICVERDTGGLSCGVGSGLGRPLAPGLGVLAHVTSLPAEPNQSAFGAVARRFVDALAEAGVRYWQILPLNPTDEYGSPYAGISAFAGNTRLLGPGAPACSQAPSCPPVHAGPQDAPGTAPADSQVCHPEPGDPRDERGYARGLGSSRCGCPQPSSCPDDDRTPSNPFAAFCERERTWLEPYACFMALREQLGADTPWQEWPRGCCRYNPEILERDPALRTAADAHRRAQFAFQQQWDALHSYANRRGVQIIGDLPIYVGPASVDTWAHPELFQLGPDGYPQAVAGCPPDAFAPEGQIWNNPLYDWNALQESGYAWWMQRLQRACRLYDFVRLDHFIGFQRYFCIPAGQPASAGEYRPGPGLDFFQTAHRTLGPLPLLAEDLGAVTPEVRDLLAACGFPGMDVLQFAEGGDPLARYEPAPGKVAYTGTHDNQTLVGFCAQRYPDQDAHATADVLLEKAVASRAAVCVVPLQDVLGLGDEARTNTPGSTGGNWSWQATAAELEQLPARLEELVALRTRA